MRKVLIIVLLTVASVFSLDWGIWGGPGVGFTTAKMDVIHDVILTENDVFPDYDVSSFANYQLGLAIPVTFRLQNIIVSAGNCYSWPTFRGENWNTRFEHNVDVTSGGYIFGIGKHLRIIPLVGFGNYNITMRISERGSGGFADPDEEDVISRTYDYYSFSVTGGVELDYVWKLDNNLVLGVGTKALYLLPLTLEGEWDARGGYDNAYINDFKTRTPLVNINFVIGYESADEEIEELNEEW